MYKAQFISETSWVLYKKTERFGLLIKIDNSYKIFGGPIAGTYSSLENIHEKINSDIIFEKPIDVVEPESQNINNFPIRHTTVYDINITDEYTTYTKRKGSDDIYIAGYFILKSDNGWVVKLCPRLKIIQNSDYCGPFKTKMEALHEIKVENTK